MRLVYSASLIFLLGTMFWGLQSAGPALAKTIDLNAFPDFDNCFDCAPEPPEDDVNILSEPTALEQLKQDTPSNMMAIGDLRACLVARLQVSSVKMSKQDSQWMISATLTNNLDFAITAVVYRFEAPDLPPANGQKPSLFTLNERLDPNTTQSINTAISLEIGANGATSVDAKVRILDVVDANAVTLINDFTLGSLDTFDQAAFDSLKRRLCAQ